MTILTPKQLAIKKRLEKFAQKHNFDLFDVRGSLHQRIMALADITKGACPCHPDTRPHCPCKQCLTEVRTNGECSCRLFITKKI